MTFGICMSLNVVDTAAPRPGDERKRSVGSSLTVDVFVSVDGWAGSDGLPGYFGYLGPELAEWIKTEGATGQARVRPADLRECP